MQQLNLAHNCLLDRSNLLSVSQMHSLYYLDLRGNPLNFHPFYRTLTCNYLHKDTAILNVILDNVPLSDTEKSLAGSLYSPGRQSQSLGSTASFPSDDSLSSRRKQPKVRTVLIQDDDETEPVERKVSEVTPSPKIVNSELKQKVSFFNNLRITRLVHYVISYICNKLDTNLTSALTILWPIAPTYFKAYLVNFSFDCDNFVPLYCHIQTLLIYKLSFTTPKHFFY